MRDKLSIHLVQTQHGPKEPWNCAEKEVSFSFGKKASGFSCSEAPVRRLDWFCWRRLSAEADLSPAFFLLDTAGDRLELLWSQPSCFPPFLVQ